MAELATKNLDISVENIFCGEQCLDINLLRKL